MKKLSPILSIIIIIVLILAIGITIFVFAGDRMNSMQGTNDPTQGTSSNATQGTSTDNTQSTATNPTQTQTTIVPGSEEDYIASLERAGFPTDNYITVIDKGYDIRRYDGTEFRLAVTFESEIGLPLIAHSYKYSNEYFQGWKTFRFYDSLDEWRLNSAYWELPGWISYVFSGAKAIDARDEEELHRIFCGTDALAQLTVPEEIIPEGLYLEIIQDGSNYIIHLYEIEPFYDDRGIKDNDFLMKMYEHLIDSGAIAGGEKDE